MGALIVVGSLGKDSRSVRGIAAERAVKNEWGCDVRVNIIFLSFFARAHLRVVY